MKKQDIILLASLLVLLLIVLLATKLLSKDSSYAIVYHDGVEVLRIDLSKDGIYTVDGENGEVELEVNNNRIRINEANCKNHTCVHQGYTNKSNEPLICIPNKIYVKLTSSSSTDQDVILR